MRIIFTSILVFIITAISTTISYGQTGCDEGRYSQEVFTDIVRTNGIGFGENAQPTAADPTNLDSLFLDFYEPLNDTVEARPLIVLAFGGSFVFGSKESPDIVDLCERFTKLGYVTASIDYRLSPELIFNGSTELGYRAVLKATHDMRAAIRHFYKDAQTTNTYKIDTSRIFIGGVSAGAIAATHMAYLDSADTLPPLLSSIMPTVGGFEGLSGNPGYSSKVKGVINLAGGVGDTTWLNAGDVPIVSAHGTADDVIPYGSDLITLFNLNLQFHGSASIEYRMDSLGIENDLYTFVGAGHAPFSVPPGDLPFRDTTFEFVRDFLVDQVCDEWATKLDKPFAKPLRIYPNPMTQSSYIELPENQPYDLVMTDLQGRQVNVRYETDYQGIRVFKDQLSSGLYFVRMKGKQNGELRVGKLVIE